ncbi:snRNA-activating protein complex subunit 4 isoform X2 [Amblyraja radiata]|uniref:snRNA-activating protein complex subunit 4 isoform X2 n=1 Tax=Amblyraja radiata TaxID=386614 RepID=UPI001401EC2C|nr:snRNA-activating protein complex subunit 4 isoform X2 [Amblyraja radiata]
MRFISLQMTQRQLLGNRFDDHDWIKISNIDFDGIRKAEDIKRVWQNSEHPSISQTQWSSEDIERLNEISKSTGYVDWESIASELQTSRTAYMCLQKYQEFNKDLKRREWSKKEDQMLTELVQKMRVGNFIPYTKIAYFMEGRNGKQIVYRWSKALDPSVTKGPWTPKEDALLLKAVAKYGNRDWYKIQEMVPGRMDSQCRDRYRNGLNQNVRKGKWTEKEESDFKVLIEKHGVGKWAKIAAELSGRTDTQCISKWKGLAGLTALRQRKRKRRRRIECKRESTPEESSEDSEKDDILEEMEQEEEDEEDEDDELVQKVEQKKRPIKRKKLAEAIVLDVDRWVPIVAKQQLPAEEYTAGKGDDNTAVEQPVANLKIESQTHRGRPRSSKIWRNIPKAPSAPPGAGETVKSASSASTVVSEAEPPPKLTQSLVATDEQQEPPRSQRNPKQPRRTMSTAKLSDTNLERRLLAEISRWTTARPLVQREIDVQRERLEAAGLSSTPVFVLLLQVFRIDKEGCMQIIKDKMNKATQSLPAITSENQSRSGPYLNQVKGTTIDVGNGKTMEMARFKLSSAIPKEKPKTVHDLLAEKRRARNLIKTTRLASRPLVIPQPLTIQQPLQVVMMPQPMSSSKMPFGLESQVAKQSSIQTRSRTKPKTESTVRLTAHGKPVAGTPQLLSEQPNGEANTGATPLPRSSRVGSSAIVEPKENITALNAASVQPAKANCGARWVQPIAPAPPVQPVLQTNGMVIPLMLPNSTVPIMALVTPQGLLCLAPGTVVGLPNQNSQTPTAVTGASPTTTVPQSGAGASTSLSSTTQAQVDSTIAPSQWEISGPSVAPVQTSTSVTLSATQPLNTPPLAVCKLVPSSSSSSVQIPQTLSPALAPSAATTSTDPPALEATKQAAANRTDGNVPTPLSTTQLAQGSGQSRVTVDVASTRSPSTQPGSVAPPEGTKQPVPPSQSDKTSIDFTLLCDDKDPVTRDWLEGKGGIRVPGTPTTLPYLPPFAATLRGFSNLLLHKKVLEQNVLAHEAADVNEPIDPKIRLEAARVQVRERLQNSPAYQLLKARFLSAFTLPALLATLPPEGISTTINSSNEDLDQDSGECEYPETDIESEEDPEGLPEHCMVEEVTSSEPNQPFEIPADLSFGCDLLGSLETEPEDQNPPEPHNVPEVSVAPEGKVHVATRRSRRLRKNP